LHFTVQQRRSLPHPHRQPPLTRSSLSPDHRSIDGGEDGIHRKVMGLADAPVNVFAPAARVEARSEQRASPL
jgi:hypothetical protein